MDFLSDILAIVAILAGAGTFGSMLVSLLKMLGLITDGTSGKVVKIVDLILFVGVAVVYFLKVPVNWETVNGYIVLAAYLIGLVVQIGASEVTYKTLRGTPAIGFTFSDKPKD